MGFYRPDLHHRRSLRLPGYDYAQAGAYFLTICTQERVELFGTIREAEMHANEAGVMIERWWNKIPQRFPSIELDIALVMPNHFHGILLLSDQSPLPDQARQSLPVVLANCVTWFKTMTTNEYIRNVKQQGWRPFPGKLWQRNYYEHIIRNEQDLAEIRTYIVNNPARWMIDRDEV